MGLACSGGSGGGNVGDFGAVSRITLTPSSAILRTSSELPQTEQFTAELAFESGEVISPTSLLVS
jgi:hypothetical protein